MINKKQFTFLSGKEIYPKENVPFYLFNIPTTLVNREPAIPRLFSQKWKVYKLLWNKVAQSSKNPSTLTQWSFKTMKQSKKRVFTFNLILSQTFEHAIQLL